MEVIQLKNLEATETAVVVGGGGTLLGPVLGSIFLVILGYVFSLTLGQANLIVFGFLFIVVMLFLPQGLMGGVDLFRPWLYRWRKKSRDKSIHLTIDSSSL